jgi:MFS family permease
MASMVGTAIEFYDFYIYATAASLVFGPLFFPAADPSTQLLAAYASFAIAFIARPLGGIAFGHFGDRIGRKATLVAALLLMGGSTVAIGLLPTYQDVGWPATAVLCVLRFGQGLGLGGEWGGAALLAIENAPQGYRGRYGIFTPLGGPLGNIAANSFFLFVVALMTPEEFMAWGWRVPFIASAILVVIGLWIRLRLTETPAFKAALEKAPPAKVPFADLLRGYPRQFIGGVFLSLATFVVFYLVAVFALGYGVNTLGYPRNEFLAVQLGAIPFMAVGIIWAGCWADQATPRRVLTVGCITAVFVGMAFAPMLASGSMFLVWLILSLTFLAMGLIFGPLGCFLPSLFPARVRYTGVSVAFNLGGVIGGGFTPLIAQTLADRGGLYLVGMYLGASGIISLLALMAVKGEYADS